MSTIKCSCGEYINKYNITDYYDLDPVNQGVLHLKYRCPRCRRSSERFMSKKSWEIYTNKQSREVNKVNQISNKKLEPISDKEYDSFKKSLRKIKLSSELSKTDN